VRRRACATNSPEVHRLWPRFAAVLPANDETADSLQGPVHEGVIATIVWWLFLLWTVVGAAVMVSGINSGNVGGWISSPSVQEALADLLGYADLVWMISAAMVVYLRVAATEGLRRARLSAVIILAGSTLVEWIGAQSGVPFGPYRYTDAFGPRMIGVLPIAIPLAWLVILLGARLLVLEIRPGISKTALSFWVAVIALFTDLNLEFIAWKVRGYWIWFPDQSAAPGWPPIQNFLSWFALAFILHALTPIQSDRPVADRRVSRAALVVPLMNVLFLLVHASRWLRP
jgi:bisanhydrobacterioruberin hydratase